LAPFSKTSAGVYALAADVQADAKNSLRKRERVSFTMRALRLLSATGTPISTRRLRACLGTLRRGFA
jgi:hypothetical protein